MSQVSLESTNLPGRIRRPVDRGRSYQRRHADLGEGLARTRVLLTSSRYVVVTSALQA